MVIAISRCSIQTFLVFQTLLHRAMLNNEQDYPEPHEFKPERFLKDGRLNNSVRDPMDIAFGFGRRRALSFLSVNPYLIVYYHRHTGRICAGQHLAHSTLTLTAASVLSTFDLLRKIDENGNEIEPKREYRSSGLR